MNKDILKRILSYAKPYAGYLALTVISAVISVSMTLYTPILIGDAIDLIVGKGLVDFPKILTILIEMAAVIAISAIFQWFMGFCTNKITHNTVRDIRNDAFERLQYVPLKYIDGTPHGDIINRVVNDIDQVADGLLQGFTSLFSGIVTILGTIIFMLTIDIPITLVVVVITPLSLFVASTIAKRSYKKFREQSALKGELGGCIEEMVSNQKIVKAFGYEDNSIEKFKEINQRLYDCGVKAQFYSSLTNPCTRFVNGLVYAAVGITGAISVIKFGTLTVGNLSAFLSYANQYTKPFNEISGVITELQSAIASAGRVFAVIDEPKEKEDGESSVELTGCEGEVSIENVSFSYNKKKPLIENLNLKAKPGDRIAIVGPTGCGKTTIINLLMRFYDVNSGDIKIDGNSIFNIKRNSLRKMYGMVLQDTWLFSGTIRDNISYGKPDATDEEIVKAAKMAHAHGFIKRFPMGYDTEITEDGGNISQGQRQLLCIARIMLTMPPMLILDEATSSIDTMTEVRIQRAFKTMMEGRTSFIVAHRLSTIKEADCILVMNAGKIIEQGTHDELIQKGGFYKELYQSQFARED